MMLDLEFCLKKKGFMHIYAYAVFMDICFCIYVCMFCAKMKAKAMFDRKN